MELILLGVEDAPVLWKPQEQTVNACWVELAERREEAPQVFTRIHMKFLSKVRTLARPGWRAPSLSGGEVLFASMMLEAGQGVASFEIPEAAIEHDRPPREDVMNAVCEHPEASRLFMWICSVEIVECAR